METIDKHKVLNYVNGYILFIIAAPICIVRRAATYAVDSKTAFL